MTTIHTTTDVGCPCPLGAHPLRSWPTPVAGIIVADASSEPCAVVVDRNRWIVVHERSGLAIAYSADPEDAIRLAVEINDVARDHAGNHIDWTQSGNAILDQLDVTKISHLIYRTRGNDETHRRRMR